MSIPHDNSNNKSSLSNYETIRVVRSKTPCFLHTVYEEGNVSGSHSDTATSLFLCKNHAYLYTYWTGVWLISRPVLQG